LKNQSNAIEVKAKVKLSLCFF